MDAVDEITYDLWRKLIELRRTEKSPMLVSQEIVDLIDKLVDAKFRVLMREMADNLSGACK